MNNSACRRRIAIGMMVAIVSLAALLVLGGGLYFSVPDSVLISGIVAIVLLASGISAVICLYGGTQSSLNTVPAYFESALDGLNEGILVLDYNGTVVFSNRAFLELSGYQPEDLSHHKAKDLHWFWTEIGLEQEPMETVPWLTAVKSGQTRCGRLTGLPNEKQRTLIMNSIAIASPDEQPRGALISLMDVTKLHQKQSELSTMLEAIRESSRQIRHQNEQLEELVLRDPLTGCYHRRYGIEALSQHWDDSPRDYPDVACLLVDVDHLRVINEIHGAATADNILREIARVLMRFSRPCDMVIRYDGEEFLVVMPETDAMEAVRRAETLRQQIARAEVNDIPMTVSIGIACRSDIDRGTPQDLLARVENCLAQAKEEGRNRVCWISSRQPSGQRPRLPVRLSSEISKSIPYPAVTALISALGFRDPATAAHSRRVADLCVLVGQRMMSMSSCYVLEMAALLHDIGKVGVPDALLHKVAPLTDEEWQVLHAHDQMGVEIVRTAFANPELTDILENYSRKFVDSRSSSHPLPLGARILAVADACDSMTSQQIYRSAMSPEDAVAELQRCAGVQFDPEIVSHFVEVLLHRHYAAAQSTTVALDAALAIGMELEGLAEAVDQQNIPALNELAEHLLRMATHAGAQDISSKALELELAVQDGTDQVGILQCAHELLSLCRATQTSYTAARQKGISGVLSDPEGQPLSLAFSARP